MAYTVLQLITGAYNKAGIVAREFGTVSGSQQALGLSELNKILADKTVSQSLIPYYTKYEFNAVVDQEEYPIDNLIEIQTLTFLLGTVRFPVAPEQRKDYFGSSRAENVKSLPYTYHFEPNFGGGTLFLYFKPIEAYPMTLWGKFRLANVDYNDDLQLSLDLFYIDFLEFSLAKRLCNTFNFEVPTGIEDELKTMIAKMRNQVAPLDTTCTKISTLQCRSGIDVYVDANLAQGWRPGGR